MVILKSKDLTLKTKVMKKTRRNIGRAYVCPELEVIVFYSALLASSPEVQPGGGGGGSVVLIPPVADDEDTDLEG